MRAPDPSAAAAFASIYAETSNPILLFLKVFIRVESLIESQGLNAKEIGTATENCWIRSEFHGIHGYSRWNIAEGYL